MQDVSPPSLVQARFLHIYHAMKKDDRSRILTLLIDMHFSKEETDRAVRLLVYGVQRTEAKPGCVECMVAQDAVERDRVRYSENWQSESALQEHLRSEEFRRVLAAMDMCEEEPRVTIGDLTGRKGIAYLQELRDSQAVEKERT